MTSKKASSSYKHDEIGKETLEVFGNTPRYNHWLYSRIRPFLKGESLLEIGCGLGNMTRLLTEEFQVTSLDIRQDYVEYIKTALPAANALCHNIADEVLPEKGVYDSACMLNVLEHIPDEKQALSNIHHALGNGGQLAVLVPAFQWLYGSVDKAIFHQRRYTRTSLQNVLEACGYTVEKTFYFNAFGIPGWFLSNRVCKHDTLPSGQLTLFDRLVPIFKVLDLPFRPFLGISVVAWAHKRG